LYPILFQSHFLTIYAYPLFLGLAWGIAYNFAKKILVEDRTILTSQKFHIFFGGLFLSGWVGAKIAFLIFSVNDRGQALQLFSNDNFWLGGGFVFYGGLMAGALFLFIYNFFEKVLTLELFAQITFPLALAHALGRIGCFLAGCCYGSASNVPWSIHLHNDNRHPTQLYEAFLLLGLAFVLRQKLIQKKSPSLIIFLYLGAYSLLRFFLEFFRGDIVRGVYGQLSTSQIISIIILLATIIWQRVVRNEQKI